jgi:SAM-dependent methyltransferase
VEQVELNTLTPLSPNWGWDRGGSIDRYYIDAFVMAALRGRYGHFLEFGFPTYKRFVEPGNIEHYDILDVAPYNPEATIVGDVQTLPSDLDGVFDVIICTQVLQLVERPDAAVRRMRGLLKPSGLMILSVPFISKVHEPSADRWRFSRKAVEELLEPFRLKEVTVAGNLFSSTCFLLGLGVGDVRRADLDPTDPQHYTVVLATATK